MSGGFGSVALLGFHLIAWDRSGAYGVGSNLHTWWAGGSRPQIVVIASLRVVNTQMAGEGGLDTT